MLPWLKMVADEDGIEADLLGKTREAQQLARRELLRRCLVSEPDHCTSPGWRHPSRQLPTWISLAEIYRVAGNKRPAKKGKRPCISELPCRSATSVATAQSCANSPSSPRPKATRV